MAITTSMIPSRATDEGRSPSARPTVKGATRPYTGHRGDDAHLAARQRAIVENETQAKHDTGSAPPGQLGPTGPAGQNQGQHGDHDRTNGLGVQHQGERRDPPPGQAGQKIGQAEAQGGQDPKQDKHGKLLTYRMKVQRSPKRTAVNEGA
jgi:hypothetical protein